MSPDMAIDQGSGPTSFQQSKPLMARRLSVRCSPFLVMLLFFPLGACSGLICRPSSEGVLPSLELQYVYGGDGPVVTSVKLFEDRTVVLESVGLRSNCKKVPRELFSEIRQQIRNPAFLAALDRESRKGTSIGPHADHSAIKVHDVLVRRRYSILPEQIQTTMKKIDDTARELFPEQAQAHLRPRPGK